MHVYSSGRISIAFEIFQIISREQRSGLRRD